MTYSLPLRRTTWQWRSRFLSVFREELTFIEGTFSGNGVCCQADFEGRGVSIDAERTANKDEGCSVSVARARAHKKHERERNRHVMRSSNHRQAFLSLKFLLFVRRRKAVFGISFARDVACLLRERVLTKSTSANATDMLRVRQTTDTPFCL